VVNESKENEIILAAFKSYFIALIPNPNNPQSFEDFQPISLCNNIYKVIAKVIARRIKTFLSRSIRKEQFGFLEGRQIHEAIRLAQEGLHSIKNYKLKAVILKIDHSKAFGMVNWFYLRRVLTEIRFMPAFVNLIMECNQSASFVVLINGLTSPFFHVHRGVR